MKRDHAGAAVGDPRKDVAQKAQRRAHTGRDENDEWRETDLAYQSIAILNRPANDVAIANATLEQAASDSSPDMTSRSMPTPAEYALLTADKPPSRSPSLPSATTSRRSGPSLRGSGLGAPIPRDPRRPVGRWRTSRPDRPGRRTRVPKGCPPTHRPASGEGGEAGRQRGSLGLAPGTAPTSRRPTRERRSRQGSAGRRCRPGNETLALGTGERRRTPARDRIAVGQRHRQLAVAAQKDQRNRTSICETHASDNWPIEARHGAESPIARISGHCTPATDRAKHYPPINAVASARPAPLRWPCVAYAALGVSNFHISPPL